MPPIDRTLWRAAARIHAFLPRNKSEIVSQPPTPLWQRCLRLAAGVELAAQLHWQHAARSRQIDLSRSLAELANVILRWSEEVRAAAQSKPIAKIPELYRDLIALQSDFAHLEYDPALHVLAVTTEPIVLEDLELGRFQIRLDYRDWSAPQPYTVVALDPNPAASNGSITHPHVNDERVCEGDGRAPIARALAEGRLGDFFMLVDRLLHTYAPGRAYVELDSWTGVACCDCGGLTDEEDHFHCSSCEEVLCSDCGSICSVCEQLICDGCATSCQSCDRVTCAGCLQTCRDCSQRVCPECLIETLCRPCHEDQLEAEERSEETANPSTPTHTPIQPHRLGQAAVSP
jgi:hypothetical protein